MCGIAGYIGLLSPNPERLQACGERMHHRGPDAEGAYQHAFGAGRHVSLLHSRLAIIDLDERANQPYRIGSAVFVFNGELYNYVELRSELIRFGHEFSTQSDTEVLLRVLMQHGWQGLDRCEGMWAFALYDEADGSLMLCRDRFGEKPLHLYREPSSATAGGRYSDSSATGGRRCRSGELYFGSEPKFIAALRGRPLEPNVNHILRYLVNGYKSLYKTRETFFVGLEELEPGTILAIDADGRERRWRYWTPGFEPDERLTREQAVEGVRAALVDSIRLRLRADVPLAFCMSGGVDSNALISIAKRRFDFDVHGFTIVNKDERYDEREEVETAVRELGIRHTAVPLSTQNFLDNLRLLVRQHDAPVYTISYYVHWLLMAAIAQHGYRISISGTAADELLTGYYDHHNLWLYEMRDEPGFPQALAAWRQHIAPLVRNPYLKNPSLYMENKACRDHIYLGNDEFASYLHQPWAEAFTEGRYSPSLLRNRMLNELFHEAVPVLLHEDDLNAMAYSVENRSPYLDRRLFEFCCRIPTRHLMRDAFTKVILREAMADVVPNRVLWNRRKVGFNVPIHALLDTRDAAVVDGVLSPGPVFDLVRRDRVEALLRKDSLPNSESKFLFSLLCVKLFLEEFTSV